MFQLQLGVNASYGYLTRDYAELAFSAEYKGERKDTSFLFILSPTQMFSLDSVIYAQKQLGYTSYTFPQGCYNTSSHETRAREGRAKDKIFIEGGGGLKAVISAQEPTLNPEHLISALRQLAPELAPDFLRVRRRRILDENGKDFR